MTGSTDVMHGETRSKSILEKQQMRLRISSVLLVGSGGKKVTIRTLITVDGPTRAKFIHGEAALLR